jgi:hypothetical protein
MITDDELLEAIKHKKVVARHAGGQWRFYLDGKPVTAVVWRLEQRGKIQINYDRTCTRVTSIWVKKLGKVNH